MPDENGKEKKKQKNTPFLGALHHRNQPLIILCINRDSDEERLVFRITPCRDGLLFIDEPTGVKASLKSPWSLASYKLMIALKLDNHKKQKMKMSLKLIGARKYSEKNSNRENSYFGNLEPTKIFFLD